MKGCVVAHADLNLILAAFDLFRDPWLDLIIPLVFGGGVIAVACGMYRMEVLRGPLVEKAETELDRAHLRAMIRRRKQVAMLIGLLGMLLMLSHRWVPWAKYPILTTVYLFVLLILVVWILLLTSGDFMANRVYLALRLSQIHQRQREMETILTHKQEVGSEKQGPRETDQLTSRETPLHQMRDADQAGHDPELN